jgi:hypothetical protein
VPPADLVSPEVAESAGSTARALCSPGGPRAVAHVSRRSAARRHRWPVELRGGRYALDTAKCTDLGGRDGRLVVDLNFLYHPPAGTATPGSARSPRRGTPSASRATRREAAVGLTVSGPLPPITRPAPKVTAIARPPSRSWRMPIAGPADRSAGLRSSRRPAGPRAMAHTADHDTRDSSRQSLTRCYHRKRARAVVFTLLHQVGKSTVLYR